MSSRSLEQWLGYLEQLHPTEIELGLDRVQAVADRLQLGRPAPRVVTVTGTNGKGSTCAFVAALCEAAGLRVGVYSSPHFLRYNERIQVQGEVVADALICQAFEAIEAARQSTSLTYFEMGTLAALWVFARTQLDIVILEVGLGGRLDAVNIVDPDLAVVTGIALDHADWLGHTREDVAREKSGIFRAGKPVVCGDPAPPASLVRQAQVLSAPLYSRGRDFDLARTAQHWHWRGQNSAGRAISMNDLPLPALPVENAALALQVAALLELPLDAATAGQVLADTRLSGRLQRISFGDGAQQRHLVLDVAHNPQAAAYVADWLRTQTMGGRCLAVFGALADKDVAAVIEQMNGLFAHWAVAALPSPRSLELAELEALLQNAGESVRGHADIAGALTATLESSSPDDLILVFGSFFSVAQAMQFPAIARAIEPARATA